MNECRPPSPVLGMQRLTHSSTYAHPFILNIRTVPYHSPPPRARVSDRSAAAARTLVHPLDSTLSRVRALPNLANLPSGQSPST